MFEPNFYIGSIRIGSVEGASCVNFGNNIPTDFSSSKKHNQGFGTVGGDDNEIADTRSFLNDADLLDMLNMDDDTEIPEWVRKIMVKQLAFDDGGA